ncbi:MAG TPA: flagellar biosynthesis protein FlgA [Micromonosporaceae bacterium]|nr:flagellar biosynthesis protein FlgA [Micromonosporaceae bacterium]
MATEQTVSRREQTVSRHGQVSSRREPSLRPARWPGRPRTTTVLRAGLVAALLTVAAGVLYSQEPACPGSPPAAGATVAGPTVGGPTSAPRDAVPQPIPRGLVGVPVRLAEPAALAVVRPGGRVDLLAVPATSNRAAEPSVVAPAALVLDVLAGESDAPSALLLALDPEQARRTVALPDTTRFAVILR